MARPRRVLLSVEPRMLSDALAEVLHAVGVDDEIVVTSPGDPGDGAFDGAIVTGDPAGVRATVVIELPEDGHSTVVVHRSGADVVIDIRETGGIVDLVERELHTPR